MAPLDPDTRWSGSELARVVSSVFMAASFEFSQSPKENGELLVGPTIRTENWRL
jgi:hypothetical protein